MGRNAVHRGAGKQILRPGVSRQGGMLLRTCDLVFVATMLVPTLGPGLAPAAAAERAKATFAGGCFWCMEGPFEKLPGVVSVTSGYTGGQKKNPTYEEVSAGGTGHAEAVQVVYDPAKVTLREAARGVLAQHRPPHGQRPVLRPRHASTAPAIFYHDEAQKAAALASKKELEDVGRFDAGPSSPRSWPSTASTRRRTTTRTSTRGTRTLLRPTARAAAATDGSRSCGATTAGGHK